MTSASGEKQHCVHDPQCRLLREFVASGLVWNVWPVLCCKMSFQHWNLLTAPRPSLWHAYMHFLQNCHARMSQIQKLWSMLPWATWRESANEACPLLPMTLWNIGFFRPRTSHHLIELKIGRIPEHWHFAFEALIGQNLQHTDSTIDSLWSQVVLMVILAGLFLMFTSESWPGDDYCEILPPLSWFAFDWPTRAQYNQKERVPRPTPAVPLKCEAICHKSAVLVPCHWLLSTFIGKVSNIKL